MRYGKVKPQLERLCKQDPAGYVSTFFDLYAVPDDFPGKLTAHFPSAASGHQKASFLERQLAQDIARRNFIPYFSVHEFEALLFTLPEKFGEWTDNANVVTALQAMADAQNTPEDINDHPQTAPSKRILSVMPGYQKTFHGPLIACEIGLEAMRQACPHFAEWLGVLEALP